MPLDLEHKAEWSKEYLQKNRERIKAYKRDYRKRPEVRERERKAQLEYRHKHPARHRIQTHCQPVKKNHLEDDEIDEWYLKRFDYRKNPSVEPVNPWIR
jgi:hypothetical protein